MELDLSKTFSLEPLLQVLPEEQRRLGFYLFLAFLAHLAAFIFIEINYPYFFTLPQSQFQITYHYPGFKSNVQLNEDFLDQWRDPGDLILNGSISGPPKEGPEAFPFTFESQKEGEYALAEPASSNDFLSSDIAPLSARVEETLRPPLEPFNYPELSFTPSSPETTLGFSDSLQDRVPPGLPHFPHATIHSLNEAGVTILSLAIDGRGKASHVLVQQSCGQTELDLLAIDIIRRALFENSAKNDLVWGTVTVFWRFDPPSKTETQIKLQNPA
jgi:hypothetical protein